MPKQIQVNLAFNADTANAKQQINDLANSLNKISSKNSQIFDDKNLKEAQSAAKDLTKHLEAAVNVNTGKLDFNKFTQSLSQSNQSLDQLYNSLSKAGPEGQKAFSLLTQSIASSDSQVLNLNSKIKDLGVTLANTVKWQLSSSLIHGFMGALQHAFGYAKDLNSSLNDIRIVTGASVNEMAKFAEQANRSAKALSSTTTEYTKASLIYYQQGLNADEVKERTDVTMKMANVSKESAQVVADQMTAVWNNFDDGTKSLEYYADVMTALGATTASSVDEIAGGLEKFAAIGDTIGLSYEYAASALATITSNTRQSEEVVGTALKTIFARIQGLNLGETLDDGTTLNKYSEALQKVGISIFDSSGELKNMDTILDEMGNRWQDLHKDQQIALAQTVAGTRQYTQLVALMDNWNDGDVDSFKSNLNTAYSSEGTLDEQQQISAESWEAAADRVKAATEDIYDSLINDEFIVDLLNGLEKVLDLTGALIDGFGGLKGILLMVGGIFAKQFANQMPEVVGKLRNNFEILTGKAEERKIKELENIAEKREEDYGKTKEGTGKNIRAKADAEEARALAELEKSRSKLTETQYENEKTKIREKRASEELVASLQDEISANEKLFNQTKKKSKIKDGEKTVKDKIAELEEYANKKEKNQEYTNEERYQNLRKTKKSNLSKDDEEFLNIYEQNSLQLDALKNNNKEIGENATVNDFLDESINKLSNYNTKLTQISQVQEDYLNQLRSYKNYSKSIAEAGGINTEKGEAEFNKMTASMKNYLGLLSKIEGIDIEPNDLDKFIEKTKKGELTVKELIEEFKKISNIKIKNGEIEQIGKEAKDVETTINSLENEIEQVEEAIKSLNPEQFEKLKKAAEEAGVSVASYAQQMAKAELDIEHQNIDNQNKKKPKKKMEFSTGLTEVASLGMELGVIFSSLGGVISTCFNDGATAGQKFLAVLSALPAITMSLADIMRTAKDLPEIKKALTEGISKIKDFNLLQSDLSKGLVNGVGGAFTKLSGLGGPLAGVFGKVGGAMTGAGTAAAGGAVSIGALAGAIGTVIGVAAAAALVIWGVVKAVEAFKASTPEGQLEISKAHAEELSTNLSNVKTEAEEIKAAFDHYDSVNETLDNCVEGTSEFYAALHDVNSEVIELLEKYPQLAQMEGAIIKDEKTGRYSISKEARESMIQESNKAILSAQAQNIQGNRKVREDEINVSKNELSKSLNKEKGTRAYQTVYQEENGITYEGRRDVSQLVSDFIVNNAEKFSTLDRQGKTDLLNQFFEKENIDDVNVESWVNAAENLHDPINKLAEAIIANTNTTEIENESIANGILLNSDKVQSSAYRQQITEAAAAKYDSQVQVEKKKLEDENWGTGTKKEKEKYFKQYAASQNLNNVEYTKTGTEDGKRYFYYKKDGEETEQKVSYEDAINSLANTNAQEVILDEAKMMAEAMEKNKDIVGKDEDVVDSLLKTGIGNLTEEQKQKFKETKDINSIFSSSNTIDALEGQFKDIHGEVEGEKKFQQWLDSLNKQITEWEPAKFDVKTWKENYSNQLDVIKDLEFGDEISPEDYQLLEDSAKSYFDEQLNGNFKLMGSAEELKEIIESVETEKLKTDIQEETEQKNKTIELVNEKTNGTYDNEEEINKEIKVLQDGLDRGQLNESRAEGLLKNSDFLQGIIDSGIVSEDKLNSYDSSVEKVQALIDAWNGLNLKIDENKNTLSMTANNLSELNQLGFENTSKEYNTGLKNIASQYEECEEELSEYRQAYQEYNETKEDSTKTTNDIKKAEDKLIKTQNNLNKAIKKAEWKKFTKDALDAAKALKKATSEEDVEKNLKTIQKAFKNAFNMDVSTETLKKFKDDFIKWGEATEEESDDIATHIMSKINAENFNLDEFTKEFDIKVNTDQANMALDGLSMTYDNLKSYIDNYRPTVSATGEADFTPMITEMLAAGATAADVAAALSMLGQTEMTFNTSGTSIPTTVDFTNPGSVAAFINALSNWQAKMGGQGNISAEEIQQAFPGGSIKGTGGGRHSGGGSKGGGGGGSKKHAEKKSDSERTRYHTLENQLEDLSAEYDEISEAADRAFGQEKLDNIDAQIEKTDELIDKQEEYLDAISQNLPIDKNVMTAYYNDVIGGLAMQFDENGNISNYDEIEEAMFNKYNSMADKYTDDSEKWQVFEKKYEQLEKYIEQYEETYDLLRDEEAAYQELLNQRADLELEKVQYKIELELEVPESEIAKLEYQIGKIEDDAYESAEAVQLLTKQAEAVYDQIQVNKQGLNDIIKLSKDYNNGVLTEEQADLIKEYRDNLLDLNEQFDDIRATIEEKVMETFDSFNEKLQTSVDVFDHYNNVLESYKNIVDIVGEDRLGISDQFMNGLNQASIDNAIEQLKATDTAMKVIQNAQAQAETALAEAKARGDEASQRMWEETLSSLNEEAQSAQEEMLSAWENALDAIAETFEATVERVVKTFNDSIYALGGLEGLQEDFSRQQENADIMLNDYQKIYELSKLSRDINKTIDDTDIIGGKQKLKKLLGEINKLQEDGVEMSQYDLEYLQKTYDLRLAELELEEAQRAKNTVRLSRDNEGNWSYIYTQNTDAVDAAQQKYEDALYAMQDLSSNYIDEMSEQLISTSQEMAEALAAIRIQDYANIEDYYAEVERVQSQYQEELAMQEEELQKAIDNNKVLYDTDWTNYHNATGYKISDTELFATTFRDTLLGALMGSEEDSANFTDIMGAAVSDLTNNLMAGAEIYYTNLENAMNAAGTSTGDFAEDTAANIDAVVEKSKEGAAAVDQMAIEMQTAMENIMDSVTNWQEAYGMAMENIIQSNLEVIESFNQMLAALSIDADSITVKYDIADAAGNQAQKFDTGGYTGEWGKGGKLAVLHEKELILKPEDTSNFLTAVQITRAMLETIDLNAKQASFGLGNLVPSTIRDDNNQTLEQQVHIVAEFPNVNDHNEIEQAFNNLINTASQYANRK